MYRQFRFSPQYLPLFFFYLLRIGKFFMAPDRTVEPAWRKPVKQFKGKI
jgi:hypothetical protein